ncbi:MAG: hypothetical protein ABIP20_18025 [Chthoniobacteraceae bacterium]
MTHAQQNLTPQPTLSRSGEQIIAALRELEESRLVGILRDEDYGSQRAARFNILLRPMRGLWLAELLGAALVGAPAGALIWFLTGQHYYTIGIAAAAGAWGFTSLGRALLEKFAELRSRGRRKVLVALLDNDLLTANEFAEYEERLTPGPQDAA